MRLAILSDLHANEQALDAVAAELAERQPDAVVCLGDVVGYGPDPVPVLDRIRDLAAVVVKGNHDEAVATGEGLGALPPDGQVAAQRHRDEIGDERRRWLDGLPLVAEFEGVTLAHAAPRDPSDWPRLESYRAVQDQFGAFDTDLCFVGHSHRPAVVSSKIGVTRVRPGARFLINVGSVGQPRDRDPRAAFGILDTDPLSYELVRVHYDVAETVRRVQAAGLPQGLGARLARGV